MKERNEYQRKAFETGKSAMKEFLEKTHSSGYHKDMIEGMVDSFLREHRTIQQEVVKFFIEMLIMWSKLPKSSTTDPRNEATYDFAVMVANKSPCFPYI